MAFKSIVPADADVAVVDALVNHMRQGETLLLAIARDVQAIRDLELYREAGVETMEAFYPILLQETSRVGWGSVRTLKAYLSFTDVYLDCLALPGPKAMGALSHLQTLYVLADWDRKEKELRMETEKMGKLPAVGFEAIVKVVSRLVNEAGDAGMDAKATLLALGEVGLATEAADFTAIAKMEPIVPAGGWSVADTRAGEAHPAAGRGAEDEPAEVLAGVARRRGLCNPPHARAGREERLRRLGRAD
jgi:hypothetical protein